jgi:Domain of unknown function (DUF4158)
LYRYQAAVRAHLGVQPYDEAAERLVVDTTMEAAETMSDPADLINRAVEALESAAIDVPAFSTPQKRPAAALADSRQASEPAVPIGRASRHPIGDAGHQPA